MLVYRVEHAASCRGPYSLYSLYNSYVLNYCHTGSTGRGGLKSARWERLKNKLQSDSYRFGFSSLACLLLWFDGCIEELYESNCVIRVYKVDKRFTIQNFNQLAFDSRRAQAVQTLNLLETAKNVYGPIDNPRVMRIIKVTKEDGSESYEAIRYGT